MIGHQWCEAQGLDAFTHKALSARHLENMNEFGAANPLKKIALNIIAQRLPESETKELRDIFDSMDLDKNGVVTYKELKMALEDMDPGKTWRASTAYPTDPKALMNLLDTNGSMKLDFTEFVAASISKSQYSNESLLLAAFKAIDSDGSGEISIQELTNVLVEDEEAESSGNADSHKPRENAQWIWDVLAEADADGSGEVDFAEFKELIGKVSLGSRKGDTAANISKHNPQEGRTSRTSARSTEGNASRQSSKSSVSARSS